MTSEEAIKELAKRIFEAGEHRPNRTGCIIPDSAAVNGVLADDEVLMTEYKATHYKHIWEEKGKSVKLTLYSASNYGAAYLDDSMIVLERVIDLEAEAKKEKSFLHRFCHILRLRINKKGKKL